MKKKRKIAVILLNLGGPDKKSSIKPFLFNFFMDKNIIGAPLPIRFLLANYIAWKRSGKEAGESYDLLGGKSPLLKNTKDQANALQKMLDKKNPLSMDFKVFVSMRYWHPMSDEVVQKVKKWKADEIILLPLYPQFSTTTTGSSFQDWDRAMKKHGLDTPTHKICCYPLHDSFIRASAMRIAQEFLKVPVQEQKNTRLLFSAHGLPEKIIAGGDPYQWQCEESAKAIAGLLETDYGLKGLDWQICYQSRVGPLKWIGPSTEQALEKAAQDKKNVLIYPHAFVSEHVETLVEIEIEYREFAQHLGVKGFDRVETVGTHETFIKGLCDAVMAKVKTSNKDMAPACSGQKCPDEWTRCPCRDKNAA